MKALVNITFKEKSTLKEYRKDSIFEGTEERIKEINKHLKGALSIIKEEVAEEVKPKRKRKEA